LQTTDFKRYVKHEAWAESVQNNLEKLLTVCPPSARVTSHTVTKNTKHMRTKSLLAAAAIIAAGVASSQAQSNVYSLNIVGYVNKVLPSGYSLIANPLTVGTNGAEQVMTPPDGSIYLTWNGAGFDYASYDIGFGGWIDSGFSPTAAPVLPPGQGFFFYNPNTQYTNTFVGTVVPAPGVTNSMALPSGYSLIGSPLPAGSATISGGAVQLPIIDGMIILQWNGVGYTYSSYDIGFGGWIDDGFSPVIEPSYNVADGLFYYNPGLATNWSQSLP
jgi:hypothetical protein